MNDIPSGFHNCYIDNNEIKLHVIHNGKIPPAMDAQPQLSPDPRPVLLLLHGFPEYHGAWRKVLPQLAKKYLVIAPDQRGFNRSTAPQDPAQYRTGLLVGDMMGVIAKMVPGRKIHLVGHDWGASVAYALAFANAENIASLTVINGVHPIPFQTAMKTDRAQVKASQYFHILCAPDAAQRMSENNFAKTFSMFENFSSLPWLDDETRNAYRQAWGDELRLNAMLNWYRASPIVVPIGDEPCPPTPLLDANRDYFKLSMPHQVIWGMEDTALLPVSRKNLEEFAPGFKLIEIADAGHWINHTHPAQIASHLDQFISRLC